MSITSNELNYLVWRYLEESGHELAAYALRKLSGSIDAAEIKQIVPEVLPGCLVELVQKGILYGLVEKDARKGAEYSLLGALAEKEIDRLKGTAVVVQTEVSGGDAEMNGNQKPAQPVQDELQIAEQAEPKPVVQLQPKVILNETISCLWHPLSEVVACGHREPTAVISALLGDKIAESVELTHPFLADTKSEINIVSWSPQGSVLVSAASNGELRAWLPDGRLRNVATAPSTAVDGVAIFCGLVWNSSGHYLLSTDLNNEVCLWDSNLTMLQQIQPPAPSAVATSPMEVCWLDDSKFVVGTARRHIKIYSVSPVGSSTVTKPIGSLAGHENGLSMLKFDPASRLLASSSDYDYLIKIWHSNSSHDAVTLNGTDSTVAHRHVSPLVCLSWVAPAVLMSVLMEGTVNVWDAKTGQNKTSVRLFAGDHSRVVYNAAVAPNMKFLACGDNDGKTTIWKIDDKMTQRGEFVAESKNGEDAQVCDLDWNPSSRRLCVSYINGPSVVLDWQE